MSEDDSTAPRMMNIDNKYVQDLAGVMIKMIEVLTKVKGPGLPRIAEWYKVNAAVFALAALLKKNMADEGIEMNMVMSQVDSRTGEETDILNNNGSMLYDWYDIAHHKLISEIQAVKNQNGGDVPLSMWEVQRMIGKVELLAEMKERIVR